MCKSTTLRDITMQFNTTVVVGAIVLLVLTSALMLSETANEYIEHNIVKGWEKKHKHQPF